MGVGTPLTCVTAPGEGRSGRGQRSPSTTGPSWDSNAWLALTPTQMPLPRDAVAAQRSTPGWAKSNTRVLAINAAWPHSTFKVGISLTSDLPLRTLLHLLFFHFWVQSTPHPLLGGLPLSGLEYLFPDSPCSACLPSAGGRGGRGDLKAPPGLTLLRRGASPGLLKELG